MEQAFTLVVFVAIAVVCIVVALWLWGLVPGPESPGEDLEAGSFKGSPLYYLTGALMAPPLYLARWVADEYPGPMALAIGFGVLALVIGIYKALRARHPHWGGRSGSGSGDDEPDPRAAKRRKRRRR